MAIQLMDESGILVSPADRSRMASRGGTRAKRKRNWRWLPYALAGVALVLIAGLVVWLRPWASSPGPQAPAGAAAAGAIAGGEEDKVRWLEAELMVARSQLVAEQASHLRLQFAQDELEAKAIETAALEDKLTALIGGSGSVANDGDGIRLQLVDKLMFRLGEAELTDKGKAILDRLGVALNEAPDKQVWVQGHTDNQPMRPAKAKKAGKAKKGAPPAPAPAPRFASNWELSAARALSVVHYLEDTARIDPRRLAAVAFGQHRPASKNRAKNRRIEIVLYPRHAIARD